MRTGLWLVSALVLALAGCSPAEGIGARSNSSAVLEGFGQPEAVALDTHGLLYVADASTGRVACVMADGQRLWLDGAVLTPGGMVTDRQGRVTMTDTQAGEVVRLEPDGARHVLARGLAEPVGLARDRDGALLVACRGDGTVRRILVR